MTFGIKSVLLMSVLILTLAPAAYAADAVGNVAAGKASYPLCVVCHGSNGEGNEAMKAPKLAGQPAWYLKHQLDAFRKGWRGTADGDTFGMQMRPIAAIIAGQTTDDLIAYIGTFPVTPVKPTIAGDIAAGKAQFEACAPCHGQNAEGLQQLSAPRLAGQDDWYLARQIKNFNSGLRGTHRDDIFGMQMRSMAAVLANDKAVDDVVAYISSIK